MNLQSVKDSISFVKKALGNVNVPIFAHYIVRDGFFYAMDGNVTAGCPVDWDADLLVPAAEFEAIINRLPSDPKVTMNGGRMELRAGRFSGTVSTLTPDHLPFSPEPEYSDAVSLDPLFHHQFKRVAAFIQNQDDTSWMTAVNVANGKMVTTNRGQMMAVVDCPQLEGLGLSIPKRAVELIAAKAPPVSLSVTANGSGVRFAYDGGAFLTTNLLAGELPAILFKRLEEVDTKYSKSFELTPEWKESYNRVAGLTEDEICFYANIMKGSKDKVSAEEEAETPVPENREYSSYNPKILTPVIEAARWFDPSVFPNAAPWWGEDGLRGLVAGKMV